MIAVVSSVIFPGDTPAYGVEGGRRSMASPNERLEQTRRTIDSLLASGIDNILVAEGSGRRWQHEVADAMQPARVVVVDQFQFRNKGISELLLLLAVLSALPHDEPILKISGRYALRERFWNGLGDADITGRLYSQSKRRQQLSTRCYLSRNRRVFEQFLLRTLREVYASASRPVGPRSWFVALRRMLLPALDDYPYEDPPIGIETAAAIALRRTGLHFRQVEELGLSGLIAGNPHARIDE